MAYLPDPARRGNVSPPSRHAEDRRRRRGSRLLLPAATGVARVASSPRCWRAASRAVATRSRPCSACTVAGRRASPARTIPRPCTSRCQEFHDGHPDDEHTRELAREYAPWSRRSRAARDDPHLRLLRSVQEPGRAGRHGRAQPRILDDQKLRLLDTLDVTSASSRGRAAARAAGRAARCAAASATTSSPAPRSSSATNSCANRWSRFRKELGEDEGNLIEE